MNANRCITPVNPDPVLTLDDAERQPCEIWTRVMGYHRPVSSFNIGKQGEFHERRFFEERSLAARLDREGDNPGAAPPSRVAGLKVA
jgi:hypothetical protein